MHRRAEAKAGTRPTEAGMGARSEFAKTLGRIQLLTFLVSDESPSMMRSPELTASR